MIAPFLSKPVRAVIGWQAAATFVLAVMAGWMAGMHGAISAALGGGINVLAAFVFGWMAARSRKGSAGEALYGALRAEAVRIVLMLLLLGLVLAYYKNVVPAWLMGSFIATVLVFTMAVFVRDR
jgi:ATP synthase protein I